MRFRLLLLFFLLGSSTASAQTWTSITRPQLGSPFPLMYAGGAPLGNRYFKINPYDNSLWFSYSNKIQRITDDGDYRIYDTSNTESLMFDSKIYDFAFTPNFSFVMDGKYGLHQFDESNWSLAIPFDEGENLAYDVDTVWCIRDGENYMKWYGGFNSQSNFSSCSKAVSKNGVFWGGAQTNGIYRIVDDQQFILYSPDTCKLMDWGNWDMKFCRHTDSMYVSNIAGLAIADGVHFVDSICTANSTNMPSGIILEFEFDADDNIWALFGDEFHKVFSLAFLNTTTKTWSNFYDTNNSPIEFGSPKVSLEIDSLGNVWVIDKHKLNVLDFGNAPAWLGMAESETISVSLFPNPTKDLFTVTFEASSANYTLVDALGKSIRSARPVQNGETISLEGLENGIYFFELTTENGSAVKRVVKN